jgi:threonine/homoserine/homoserine lactone efflux protein
MQFKQLGQQLLGIHDLWLFIVSGLVFTITPGPDIAYIAMRSVQAGWRGGAAATVGISSGCLVHVIACALGLSALLAASSAAFAIVKWAGAAYLCYVGITMLLSRPKAAASAEPAKDAGPLSLAKVYWQGALTNVLNPKVALFFLAFLPQFVVVDAPDKGLALLLLGLIFVFNATLVCLCLAAFAARTARGVRQSDRAKLWINRSLGGLFVYLGTRIALLQAR